MEFLFFKLILVSCGKKKRKNEKTAVLYIYIYIYIYISVISHIKLKMYKHFGSQDIWTLQAILTFWSRNFTFKF